MAYPWHSQAFESLLARADRLPHALLLRGREGIGKLAFAEALARALLCENRQPDGRACGTCPACNWMEQGSHPDFRRLEPESTSGEPEAEDSGEEERGGGKPSLWIKIDPVRDMMGFLNMTSSRRGPKVVLIHPAETLYPNAANALLKYLEEPPPRTHFVLVAHSWRRLLPTVLSRCEQVVLAAPPREAARAWLEGQGLRDPDLALSHAGGAPLLALAFDEEYWQQRQAVLAAISGARFNALASAEQLRETAPRLVLSWLQKWAFDLVSHKVTGGVRYNPDFAEAIAATAKGLELLDALRFQRQMVRLQRIVSHPLNARLFLEHLLLEYGALLRNAG